jgi:hypothetical protein
MRRPLLLLAIFSLCANGLHGRGTAASRSEDESTKADASPAKPRPAKRVLFRTDSPRLFSQPAAPRLLPVAPKPPEVKPPEPRTVSFRLERPKLRTPIVSTAKPRTRPVPPVMPELALQHSEPATLKVDLHLQPTSFTPYDPYMGTVRAVFSSLDEHDATMVDACQLVREGRRFRYTATDPYRAQPPSVTESKQSGDCKAKALWLYEHLGDSSALYVIGKMDRRSRTSHAWVYWPYGGRWWILDPTDRFTPIAADSVSASRYVPYYSYSRAGSFRHRATSLMLASNTPAAAGSAIAVQARSKDGSASGR